jgi:chromosome partitioning protein
VAEGEPARSVGRVVAIAGLKGGCGKTTLAVGLTGVFTEMGLRTALADADPAGAAVAGLRRGPAQALRRALPLRGKDGLPGWLEGLAALRAAADLLLLDLPPADPLPLAAAALTSDVVLLPVAPTALDLAAARATLGWLERARAGRSDGRPRLLAVPNRIATLGPEVRTLLAPIEALGLPLAPPLRLRDGHDRAYRESLPVGSAAPGSPEHRELRAIGRVVVDALGLPARLREPAAAEPVDGASDGQAAPVRTAYLDEPPGARGPLDLGAYRRRLRDRLWPLLLGRR